MTLEELQNEIGVHFINQALVKQAFFHRSYLNEAREVKESNERLEFLGDSVLSFLTSEFLYNNYPDYPEGILTNIRSSLVKTTTLSEIAKSLHLGELLFLSKGEEASGGRTNQSLLADAFEALLGAMVLDQGIAVCKTYLAKYVFPRATEIIAKKTYIDFKSYLQEVIQQTSKASPVYDVVKSEGPDHARTFWIEVKAGQTVLGTGTGHSKQEAEQGAAMAALEKLGKI